MNEPRERLWILAGATLLAPVSWGTTYVTVTELLPADRPMFIAAIRVTPAALVLLAVGARLGRGVGSTPRSWRHTLVLSVANFGAFFPLLILAATRLPGGVAAAAGGLQPLLVGGLTWVVAGERPRWVNVMIGVVAAIGVAMVVVRPGAGLDPVGVGAAVASAVSFAIGVVLTRRFGSPPDPVAETGRQLAMSAVVLVPLALAVEGLPPVPTATNLVGFAYLSLGGTAVAYLLWFRGVRRLPAAAPPLLGLAAPLTGALLGWVLLGQALAPVQVLGFALVVGAIAYGALVATEPAVAADEIRRARPVAAYLPDDRRALRTAARGGPVGCPGG